MKVPSWFHSLENEWEVQILLGERLRSRLILIVLFLFVAVDIGFHVFFPQVIDEIFVHRFPTLPSFLGSGLFLLYEIGFFFVQTWGIKHNRQLPPMSRWANAVIETSIPTLALIVASKTFSPEIALNSPFYLVYFLFIILSAIRMNVWLTLFTGILSTGEYLLLSITLLPSNSPAIAIDLVRVFMLFLAGALTAVVTFRIRSSVFHAWQGLEDKNRIINLFGQQVSPAVVQKLLNQPQENLGENLPVTVLFLDIRGFTAFSEQRSPEKVVEYLNGLFDFMIDVINRHHGIINKFLGDGFMAIFGAPVADGQAEANALASAVELVGELENRIKLGQAEPTRIGIGIHRGIAVTGNVGSSQRREYTVIGDVVNTASRLETLNKELGTTILASDEVWQAGKGGDLSGLYCGEYQLRGKEQTLTVWEVLRISTPAIAKNQA